MAGGSGERFWPLSRRKRPKQLLKLTRDDRTLLEEAVERMLPLIPEERLFIATSELLRDAICEARLVPPENVLAEPCKRNTAGCLAFVSAHCLHRYGEKADTLSLAITTADHYIGDANRFRQAMVTALKAVETESVLAIVGIPPTRPETGFGYIEISETAMERAEMCNEAAAFPVDRFREKPNRETAEDFIATGRFFWNSGMFFWRLSTFLSELGQARPELVQAIRKMATALDKHDDVSVQKIFEGLEDVSIDYALMERARNVVMVRADFPWDDIGSWDALDRTRPKDEQGNVVTGDPILIDARECVVFNEPGDGMAVGVVGVEGLAVVVSSDGVLVIPKDRAQDVRQVVAELKKRGATQL